MNKVAEFNRIIREIKEVKIQGASNIARVSLKAYYFFPNSKTKKKLVSLRPTEPMLFNVLEMAEKHKQAEILRHFSFAQDKINKVVFRIIKNNERIFTHCHSTNVVRALVYAKKKGKKFQVYNTETRPLFQGRKTSKELSSAGIKVTQFVDSAFAVAIEKDSSKDKIYSTKVFLGADALLKKGIINKVGSKTISELALLHKIPVYIVADSWKFTNKKVPLENRSLNEIWGKSPKKIKIKNPAFEFIPKKYIKAIISDLGILSYGAFLKKIKL